MTALSVKTMPTFYGMGGDDRIDGSATINMYGEGGDNFIYGDGDNHDIIDGGDYLYGDAGDDLLDGGDGNDFLYGGQGDDALYGRSGNDIFWFDSESFNGHDTIYGFSPTEDIIDLRSFFNYGVKTPMTYSNNIIEAGGYTDYGYLTYIHITIHGGTGINLNTMIYLGIIEV